MPVRRQILSVVLPVIAALAAPPPTLAAQGRPLFEWSGRVDREVRIAMRGREAWTNAPARDERRGRANVVAALPRQEGIVRVRVEDGRGDVAVIQQPNARNDYTTVVRVVDRSGGADRYRLRAYWTPTRDGRGGWDDRRDRRDRDDWDDRRRDRDRDDWEWDDDDRRRGRDDRWDRGRDDGRGRGPVSVLRWSGAVDGDLEIRLRDGQVTYRTLSGAGPRDLRVDGGAMPPRGAEVRIANAQGRGSITVVQQPAARNAFTTIIRVRDPQGGYGFYDFDLVWR